MAKIVILDGKTLNPGDLSWDPLYDLAEVTIYDRTALANVIERIGDAEFIFTNKTLINEKIIKECPNLKYIGVLATGYNLIDLDAAKKHNIVVCNVPAYGTKAVAQFVFSLLLEVCSNVGLHNNLVKKGKWSKGEDFCFWDTPLIELSGKCLGLVGFGNIGQDVAKIANALGMHVIYNCPNRKQSLEHEQLQFAQLEDIYKKSDVISLHAPLTSATKHIINAESIALMKANVIVINTARGELIDESALVDALETNRIYAAACDVVAKEPIDANNPLLKCHNFVVTPHIAWAPRETRLRLLETAIDNLKAFIEGEIKNQVN